eukprot:scaffold31860_cov90-Isochrysis_galbana.AAC.3
MRQASDSDGRGSGRRRLGRWGFTVWAAAAERERQLGGVRGQGHQRRKAQPPRRIARCRPLSIRGFVGKGDRNDWSVGAEFRQLRGEGGAELGAGPNWERSKEGGRGSHALAQFERRRLLRRQTQHRRYWAAPAAARRRPEFLWARVSLRPPRGVVLFAHRGLVYLAHGLQGGDGDDELAHFGPVAAVTQHRQRHVGGVLARLEQPLQRELGHAQLGLAARPVLLHVEDDEEDLRVGRLGGDKRVAQRLRQHGARPSLVQLLEDQDGLATARLERGRLGAHRLVLAGHVHFNYDAARPGLARQGERAQLHLDLGLSERPLCRRSLWPEQRRHGG